MEIKKVEVACDYAYSIRRQNDETLNFDVYHGHPDEPVLTIEVRDGSELTIMDMIGGLSEDVEGSRVISKENLDAINSGRVDMEGLSSEEFDRLTKPKEEIDLTVEEARALRDFLNDPKTIQLLGL